MGGRGSHPFGWVALALVVVAYARVILELAGAALALAIAVRILTAVPWRPLAARMVSRGNRAVRRGTDEAATERSRFEVLPGGREGDRPGDQG